MNMLPGPAQAAAIGLSVALPLLLLCYARIAATGGSGRRFRLGCVSILALYAIACIALPVNAVSTTCLAVCSCWGRR